MAASLAEASFSSNWAALVGDPCPWPSLVLKSGDELPVDTIQSVCLSLVQQGGLEETLAARQWSATTRAGARILSHGSVYL